VFPIFRSSTGVGKPVASHLREIANRGVERELLLRARDAGMLERGGHIIAQGTRRPFASSKRCRDLRDEAGIEEQVRDVRDPHCRARANPANPAAAPGGAGPPQVFDGEPRPYAAGCAPCSRYSKSPIRSAAARSTVVGERESRDAVPTSSQRRPEGVWVATALAVRVNRRAAVQKESVAHEGD